MSEQFVKDGDEQFFANYPHVVRLAMGTDKFHLWLVDDEGNRLVIHARAGQAMTYEEFPKATGTTGNRGSCHNYIL